MGVATFVLSPHKPMPISPRAKHCTFPLPDLRHLLKATTSAGSANEEALTMCTFSSARAPCAAARSAKAETTLLVSRAMFELGAEVLRKRAL
jgi:hypothetical protein